MWSQCKTQEDFGDLCDGVEASKKKVAFATGSSKALA